MTHKDIIEMDYNTQRELKRSYGKNDYILNCYNDVEMFNNMSLEEFENYQQNEEECAIAFCDGVALLWATN